MPKVSPSGENELSEVSWAVGRGYLFDGMLLMKALHQKGTLHYCCSVNHETLFRNQLARKVVSFQP